MDFRLNTLRQSSARSWRIGQTKPCNTSYIYYNETSQQKLIQLMAKKLVAAEFLEGALMSGGGLMSEADDVSIEMAIIQQLAESIRKERAA